MVNGGGVGRRHYWLLIGLIVLLSVIGIISLAVITWLMVDRPMCAVTSARADTSTTTTTTTSTTTGRFGPIVLDDLVVEPESGQIRWFNDSVVERLPAVAYRAQRSRCTQPGVLLCLRTADGYTIQITRSVENAEPTVGPCYSVKHTLPIDFGSSDNITTCLQYGGHHWYGAAQIHHQYWPADRWSVDMQEFVAGDSYMPGVFGGVLERYWLSSAAVSVHVPADVPLSVSMNSSGDQQLCLASKLKDTVYRSQDPLRDLTLEYEVCRGNDLTSLHKFASRRYWSKPTARPNLDTLVKPIWSTWALYKKEINQTSLLQFAEQITTLNLPISQLELDDDWTPRYGDWTFNQNKFPDPREMIAELKRSVPAVTVWVHPFVNVDSQAFQRTSADGLLMNVAGSRDAVIPGLTTWWNLGLAGYLDFSNNQTADWFNQAMASLQRNYGVDSFKFDAGETKWMPSCTQLQAPYFDPSEYIEYYIDAIIRADPTGRRQEARVGYRTQHAPILIRMMDRQSHWGYANGLRTVIPATLTFGLLGYPFVLPDMIGGNAYDGRVVSEELFIRWLQLNVFLPSIQFSVGPWSFSQQTVDQTRSLLALRESYGWLFDELSREAVSEGWPIVRPLWWSHPTDSTTRAIDDQFLLGDRLLVAPVVEEGAVERDVYLPAGQWRDKSRDNSIVLGPVWIRSYPSPLYTLPYFERVDGGKW